VSWEAVQWAFNQDPGYADLKYVLIGACDFANKRTGKIYATAQTIADFTNHRDLRTIRRCLKNLTELGLLIDTGERTGGNGRVPVWIWAGFKPETKDKQSASDAPSSPKKQSASRAPSSPKLSANKGQTKCKQSASRAPSFIGEVGPNLEPLTRESEGEDDHIFSSSSLKKDEKKTKSRAALKRPTDEDKDDKNSLSRPEDADEVWGYIYNANDDHPEEETAALKKYFTDLAGSGENDEEGDRDIEYWVHVNEKNGWRGVTDWRVHLKETFLRGWFPSQKRNAKRRLK
jgi:hypothetical protein